MPATRRSILRPWAARTRIVAWLLSLVLVAVAANQLIASRVLHARVDDDLVDEVEHEYEKFRTAAELSPTSGSERPTKVYEFLDGYLATNVAEPSEALFSIVDGRPDRRSRAEPLARLDKDAVFVRHAAAARAPTFGRWDSDAGEVLYGVFPVRVDGDDSWGQLVVVEFAAPAQARASSTLRTLALVSLVGTLTAALAAWLVAGRILRPVRQVRDTAERIGEEGLDERIVVTGDDEVAQLARTFNRMLDRIQSAFAGQRQFLDDAGHELRTPLTVIRGHLEVMGDSEEERAWTLGLVTDELDRMSRIVDDLLLLARSERPDFIAPEPVDLADLTVEALAKASAMADRRWLLDEVAEQSTMADPQRLTQALMQLTANAVEHTDGGGRISFGSKVAGDRILVWVDDDGPGVPVEDREAIFDRFTTAGRRGRDSTGLGLAIVRSIAEGHGGTARVEDGADGGARFVLDLPLRPPAHDGSGDLRDSAPVEQTLVASEPTTSTHVDPMPAPEKVRST
ncbi:MAG: HAMP domain-containing histidine kinase [Acidimicrobiales bacterium]|nr:HAMP domain-containing histidine kinase [Acidimicrobiales bacterium]